MKKDIGVELFRKMVDLAVDNPDLAPDRLIVLTGNKKDIERIITPARLKLMRTIKETNPETVNELSKKLKRSKE